jgi:hypothetical protein
MLRGMTFKPASLFGVTALKRATHLADALIMSAPKITAADVAAAATRIAGVVIHDIAGVVSGPAVYAPRLEAFVAITDTDEVIAADDGTVLVLVQPGEARELIDTHGTPGRAAQAVNRRVAAEWRAAR